MVREHALIDGSAALEIDPAIVAWLEGGHELDRALAGRVEIWPAGFESPRWPLDMVAQQLHEGWQRGVRWRVQLRTDDALVARWCAAAIGQRLGLPVLGVASGALAGEPEAAVRLHRQGFLDACVPCTAAQDSALLRPAGVSPCPLLLMYGCTETTSGDAAQTLNIELPAPDADERRRLWRVLWPESQTWAAQALSDLALCHEAGATDIAAAAASAPIVPPRPRCACASAAEANSARWRNV